MRYYEITLTNPGNSTPARQWSSHPKGVFDPGALEIEFDCQVTDFATATQAFTITIHGVSLQDISQAQQFGSQIVNGVPQPGMTFSLKAGMKAGLPLANPKQAGLLVVGEVIQSYGNWQGADMRLDLVVVPSSYTINNPGNLVLNWQSGTTLSQALQNTLSVAYPNVPLSINLSNQLVQSSVETHFCSTLQGMAQCLRGITQGYFLGPSYGGVRITAHNGQVFVWDDSYTPPTIQLAFTDFVGQPTWIGPNTMVMKLVLRADLQPGTMVRMPQGMQNSPGSVGTKPQSQYPSSRSYQTAFQGTFLISELRHIGSFRTPDGSSWVTIATCQTSVTQ